MIGEVGKPERVTQDRVIALFKALGYRYLGDWSQRGDCSNVEESILSAWLQKRGYSSQQIVRALQKLRDESRSHSRSLYENNRKVYELLRYGVTVQVEHQPSETLWLIDWNDPEANDFAIAEEGTLTGSFERRPDLVLYVNGIALAVIELKSSRVGVGEGIRQILSNQSPEFHGWFFSTVQITFAGNDSEGLRYGAIGTPEKFWLRWKEEGKSDDDGAADGDGDAGGGDDALPLDRDLVRLGEKRRFLEIVHVGVLFDGGIKKLPRPHQWFGLKAAQEFVRRGEGGVIWHTQGAGKSLLMVLLAKWILEHDPEARVLVVTDRDELDKQIEGVFESANETMKRARSGQDLLAALQQPTPRLLCSLVHKFGRRGPDGSSRDDFEAFLKELESDPLKVPGKMFVFVDECHRTQGGKLHDTMKALIPDAVIFGFTGTPLLKRDKKTSLERFGRYVHTYKFSEAVRDGVVLDLVYEARDVDQVLGDETHIDAWFEAKTKALNDWQKGELKKRWGTLQQVLSSRSRMERIVQDVVFDFATKPRLSSQRGNAMLVAGSIYEACRYFELFQKTELKGKCAVITSYDPQAKDVSKEETGANTETDKQFVFNLYTSILKSVPVKGGRSRTEVYEDESKRRFVKEPATMKLLVVVDKLLTGFDAPPCTYLYLDKRMQDHGLFQAICRTNRLDGEDKKFGYVVDYRDLFQKLVNDEGTGALQVYSSELDHSAPGASPEVVMENRITKGRKQLDEALEAVELLCGPVMPPREEKDFIRYFCGNTEKAGDLAEREPVRVALYKMVASFVRAYANLADELERAGYSPSEIAWLKNKLDHYVKVRDVVRLAAGEVLDMKPFEADMRHLIDTYVEAKAPRKISPFEDEGLLEVIAKVGVKEATKAKLGALGGDREAIAETIENNVRAAISQQQLNDPAFYAKMSALLDEVIRIRKERAEEYERYLQEIAKLVAVLQAGHAAGLPKELDSPGKVALYNNLDGDTARALDVDRAVREARPDGWRGVVPREQMVKRAIFEALKAHGLADPAEVEREVERVFAIVKAQREY